MTPTEMLMITAGTIDQLAAQNMRDYRAALQACGYSPDEIATALADARIELARRRRRALCEMHERWL
jgi:hypothetical protein